MRYLKTGAGFLLALSILIAGCDSGDQRQTEQSAQPNTATPDTPTTQRSDCSLTLGWDPWEPYQFRNPDGTMAGLDIEIFEAVAEQAGCDVDYARGEWRALQSKLKAGEIDVLAGASITPQRQEFALFSQPYRDESFVLYVRKGDAEKFAADDLEGLLGSGLKIGVTDAYIYGSEVSDLQENPDYAEQFVRVDFGEVNLYNLLDSKVDGMLEDPFVGAFLIRRKGFEDRVEAFPLSIYSGQVFFMFSQESVNEERVTRFNEALAKIRDDGTYEEILKRYSF